MIDVFKVHVPEEGVSFDGFCIILARTKTPERIPQ